MSGPWSVTAIACLIILVGFAAVLFIRMATDVADTIRRERQDRQDAHDAARWGR